MQSCRAALGAIWPSLRCIAGIHILTVLRSEPSTCRGAPVFVLDGSP
jgi:hypothetical protein